MDRVGTTDRARLAAETKNLASAWLANAATPNGFQKTEFDANWRELPSNDTVDLTSQARLVYLYAAAFDLSGEPRYLEAMVNAADFMLRYMQGVTEADWVNRVSSSGLIIDNTIDPYGYSFVVFSLSHAYRVSGDERYLERALKTWRSDVWPGLKATREWPASAESGLKIAQGNWSQNAYMHLFEALLALHEVTHSVEVWADIVAMAKFLDESLIQSCACLPEWFLVPGFTPLNGDGAKLYLGHQVEWAYLLDRAVHQGLDSRYQQLANKLLTFAIRYGVSKGEETHRQRGGLHATADLSGELIDDTYWWWAQAELLRVTLHFYKYHGRSELRDVYADNHVFSRLHFIDLQRGSWTNESPFLSHKTPSQVRQVIGYHWMAFYQEALNQDARSVPSR